MRLSLDYNLVAAILAAGAPADPSIPNLAFLAQDTAGALRSFFGTVDRITADNPVAAARHSRSRPSAPSPPGTRSTNPWRSMWRR